MASPTDTVRIFDTTLRDGEQSPGIALSAPEKIEIARQLARLGVDVIEAGFAISSPGAREGIRAVSQAVDCVVASLARTNTEDVDAAIFDHTVAVNLRAPLLLARSRNSDELAVLQPMRLFHLSNLYLTLLFVAVALVPFVG